jgi:predicted  nucleic acid-binding Zn-ribbon protein
MHPDLERVIHLQQIEDAAERARRTIADEPARQQQLAAALEAARLALEHERARLAANQAARREIEKELAMQQARLSKFRDQLMEVKTNREYQAMQKEIETAQHEIRKHEDRLLEQMIEFDDVTQQVKEAEQAFAREQAAIETERAALAAQLVEAAAAIGTLAAERAALAAEISPPVLALFERVLKYRKTAAVTPVRGGRCSTCQILLRPQTVNEIRRNEIIYQCESCLRILYYEDVPQTAASGAPAPADPASRPTE